MSEALAQAKLFQEVNVKALSSVSTKVELSAEVKLSMAATEAMEFADITVALAVNTVAAISQDGEY